MTSNTAAITPELDDADSTESTCDHPSPEYLEFLRRTVEKARISMREGRGRSHEEVKAAFAEKHARTLARLSS